MAWQMPDGELRPMRCGRSNHCPYCGWLAAQENVLVTGFDAVVEAPTVGFTLTTTDADFAMPAFRDGMHDVFRRLRRKYDGGRIEYLALMEWTTGKSERSRGRRFPHAHGLIKGARREDAGQLHAWIRETWQEVTGAWVTDCRELRTAGGAIAYMVGHHHKREQAPPRSFKGKRFRPSQGYFHRPVAELRERARATIKRRAAEVALLRQMLDAGVPEGVIDGLVDELVEERLTAAAPKAVRVADGKPREVEAFRRHLRRPAAA